MATTGDLGTFLLFGDVHFNPFADPSLVPKLAASDVAQWKSILSSSDQTAYATYGEDTNYSLFESALDDMGARAGFVSTIIYPGDVLGHNFGEDYASLTGDTSQAGLNSFIQKTVEFFTQEVESRFPDATVVMTDGNADSALGATGSKPGDPYLSIAAPIFGQAFFKNPTDQAAFETSFAMGGYYAVSPDGLAGPKYISLNDNLWTSQNGDVAAGMTELSWFALQLADSAEKSQKVYVVTHIPVGAATSLVASNYEATGQLDYTGNLENGFDDAFEALETAYSATIAANFAGHTHNDDFRLIGGAAMSSTEELMRITPSISPVFGNNPGYQIYSYNPLTFSLVDEATYTLDLQSSSPDWSQEYDYAQAYGQTLATPEAWNVVYAEILTNPIVQAAYCAFLSQGATGETDLSAATLAATLLTPGFTSPATFNAFGAILTG